MNINYSVILPQLIYAEAFATAYSDYCKAGEQKWIDFYSLGANDFTNYVKQLLDSEKGINVPDGRVPETTRWLMNTQQEIIGFTRVRHGLTPTLEEEGGHIDCDVPPSQRKKGHGHHCLQVAVNTAKELGLQKTLLTCYSDNLASKRIIEAAGAKLQDEIILKWKPYVVVSVRQRPGLIFS